MNTKYFASTLVIVVSLLAAVPVQADVMHMGSGLTSLEFVNVGNAGNAADTRYIAGGVGSVGYEFQMGKFEFTAAQYTEFLNAVARTDTYGLYNTGMALTNGVACGINRTGTSGSYVYTTTAGRENFAVDYVDLWDAARLCNWLHNGQPTGAQGSGTTESGAYTGIGSWTTFARQSDAKFFIPNENEWYKAAYYDPTLNGGLGGYWDYETKSNTVPTKEAPSGTDMVNGSANYGQPNVPGSVFTYAVGSYTAKPSTSFYGTFDQAGNISEFTETRSSADSTKAVMRGGNYMTAAADMGASKWVSARVGQGASYEYGNNGFRVAAAIPEPGTLALLAAGLLGLLAYAWRKRK